MAAEVNGGSGLTNLNDPIETGKEAKELHTNGQETDIPLTPNLAAEEARKEEIRLQIHTIEEEINTLQQALTRKESQLSELKRELGITAWTQLREGIGQTYHGVQQSRVYQKTSESLKDLNDKIVHSEAYNKLSHGASATKIAIADASGRTVTAVKTAGSATAKKLGEIRDSTAFQSFENKVISASSSIKEKVVGPKQSSFEEVLNSTTKAQEDEEGKKAPVLH